MPCLVDITLRIEIIQMCPMKLAELAKYFQCYCISENERIQLLMSFW